MIASHITRSIRVGRFAANRLRAAMTGSVACLLIAATPGGARAGTQLDIRYDISVAKIAVGELVWTTTIGADRYVTAANGKASGVASMLFAGEGTVSATGKIANGLFDADSFKANLVQDDDKSNLSMTLDNGNVTDLVVTSSSAPKNRIPVTEQHKRGIVDPLTAMLIPASTVPAAPSREACTRILPIFDGNRRYDLALSFKRMATVKAETGYQGAAAVCAVKLRPISGYSADSKMMKYLTDGRDIEIWLAPVGGEKVLAPFQFSISSMLGDLLVQATRFAAR
jgi:hypothetical protein